MVFAGKASTQSSNSLKLRLLSSVVGIPVLLTFIWAGSPWLLALVVAVVILGLLEFYRMVRVQRAWLQRLPGLVIGVSLVAACGYEQSLWLPVVIALSLPVFYLSYRGTSAQVRPWLLTVAGPMYLGATLAYVTLLRGLDEGASWLMLAVVGTFAVDTSAYLVGKAIGRHHMAERVSPGKTWEGAMAGLAGGIVATVLLANLFPMALEPWQAFLLGAGIGVVSQAGDLMESMLKRAANVKDAGWVIPGHGGLLDRLDSIVLSLVLVYYGATWGVT